MATAAKRYAKALFAFALEKDCLDAVYQDLGGLQRLYQDAPEFSAFMDDPMLTPERRAAVLDRLFGDRAHPATLQFLHFLEAKGRLRLLRSIVPVFEALVRERQGILRISILSASPLDAEQIDRIKQSMADRFNRRIDASVDLDPSLIGGFRIRVGDTIHDYSIATQLEMLKRELMTT